MKIIKNSIYLIIILIFSIILNKSISFWYLNHLNEYKLLKYYVVEKARDEYSNYKVNELYQKSKEFRELQELVKIDTIFDISAKELENNVLKRKNQLLNRLRERTFIETWQREIDNEIAKLDKNWRYLVWKLPWQLITITENSYIYIHKHKTIWNVDVINQIQSIFNTYRNKDNLIMSPNWFKQDLLKLLNQYKIKHIEINWNYLKWKIHVWESNKSKIKRNANFFISKSFTTPFLEEEIETNFRGAYVWTYLTDEDLKFNYNVNEDRWSFTEIYIDIDVFDDVLYMWLVGEKNKIIETTILWWNLDIFLYKIQKNSYEYFIFIIVIILGAIFWVFLVNNFIINYRSNFKRIPEEL